MIPIPRVGQTATELVVQADAATAGIQNFSDTYLQPLKIFNSVVTTIAQIALGVVTSAVRVRSHSGYLRCPPHAAFRTCTRRYPASLMQLGFLLEDNTLRNIDNMRATLQKIARVISDVARFVTNYSQTQKFWKRPGKNTMLEMQTTTDGYISVLNDLL